MKTPLLVRSLTFVLLVPACALAQTEAVPITGRVLNAADGTPIAGAVVHYRGAGNTFDQRNRAISPPTLQGEVTTGPDGSYSTPPLPVFGDFTLRASAPGFFAAKDWLQAIPARLRDNRPPPLPPGFVPPPGYKPPLPHDGTLRLRPDPIDLRPMSDAALAAFALPLTIMANRAYLTASFSADNQHLAFLTLDSLVDAGKSITRHCRIWDYNLATGQLSTADLVDSPSTAPLQHPDLPPGFCDSGEAITTGATSFQTGYSILWNGDTLYILDVKFNPNVPTAAPAIAVFVLNGSRIALVPAATLPPSVQNEIAARTAPRKLPLSIPDTTADGRFSVSENFDDDTGRGSCARLVAITAATKLARTIATDCPGFSSRVDPTRDVVFYTQPTDTRYPNHVENIEEFNLVTGHKRTFSIPAMNDEPELLAEQSLPNGATRLAYTIHGDCDFAASDYSQPGQPDGVLGNTPKQFSVCFVTIPPAGTP